MNPSRLFSCYICAILLVALIQNISAKPPQNAPIKLERNNSTKDVRTCATTSFYFYDFLTVAAQTNPPSVNPAVKSTDALCESYCDLSGVLGWTRQKSTQ